MFYVLDDTWKLYHVTSEDGVKFEVDLTTDLNHIKQKTVKAMKKLKERQWFHLPITRRSITVQGTTFNLKTGLGAAIERP